MWLVSSSFISTGNVGKFIFKKTKQSSIILHAPDGMSPKVTYSLGKEPKQNSGRSRGKTMKSDWTKSLARLKPTNQIFLMPVGLMLACRAILEAHRCPLASSDVLCCLNSCGSRSGVEKSL